MFMKSCATAARALSIQLAFAAAVHDCRLPGHRHDKLAARAPSLFIHCTCVIATINAPVPSIAPTVIAAGIPQITPRNTRDADLSVCGLLIPAMNKTAPKVNATAVMQLASAVSFSQLPASE